MKVCKYHDAMTVYVLIFKQQPNKETWIRKVILRVTSALASVRQRAESDCKAQNPQNGMNKPSCFFMVLRGCTITCSRNKEHLIDPRDPQRRLPHSEGPNCNVCSFRNNQSSFQDWKTKSGYAHQSPPLFSCLLITKTGISETP